MSECQTEIYIAEIRGTSRKRLNNDQLFKGDTETNMRCNDYKNQYDFGFRKMGDSLIGHTYNMHVWNNPLNVELVISCKANKDLFISNAVVQFDQSFNGKQMARIVGGGIGTDYVQIYVWAENTFWLRYDVKFYGGKRDVK